MEIDKKLVEQGLKKVRKEKYIQGKILEATKSGNYELVKYLQEAYNNTCNETDRIARDILKGIKDPDMIKLNEFLEDFAANLYGENCSEGLSFSFIVANLYMRMKLNGRINTPDSLLEELYYSIHTFATDKYLNSEKGRYKEEMLEHVNNNISRSNSLRALFRGDMETFNKYNPDNYFDPIEAAILGEEMLKMHIFTSCVMLDEINRQGARVFLHFGFNKQEANDIIKAQKDMEILKLASYYAQAKKRNFNIQMNYNQFSEATLNNLKIAFEIGEDYSKDNSIEKAKKL